MTSERRWAVRIRYCYHGDWGEPFLAGRFFFNLHGDHGSDETHPPTATFKTRAQARKRCASVRRTGGNWRVSAQAVPVLVVTTEVTS